MDDPYETLGVPHDANQNDIRHAYRTLAKKHHPDLNPGNAKAEGIFKNVSIANELLSDPIKRGQAALPVVLSLLDQLYDLRRRMHELSDAIDTTVPQDVFEKLVAHLAMRRF